MKQVKVINNKQNLRRFKRKFPSAKKYSIDTLKQLTDGILDEISNLIIEQPNGIVLDKIGYFCMVLPNDKDDNSRLKLFESGHSYLRDETEELYFLYFFPDIFRFKYLQRHLIRASSTFKKKFNKFREYNRIEYKNHYDVLKKLNKNVKYLG